MTARISLLVLSQICCTILLTTFGATAQPKKGGRVEVIVLGTLHEGHKTNEQYTGDVLRDLIVKLAPAAIFVEATPGRLDTNHRYTSAVLERSNNFPENFAEDSAAAILGVPLIAIDRSDRDEFYARTKYFQRLQAFFGLLLTESRTRTETDSLNLDAQILRCGIDATINMDSLRANMSPAQLNSAASDELTNEKLRLFYGIAPGVVARNMTDDKKRAALKAEVEFFRDEWKTRTDAMVANILQQASAYVGRRVVVAVGCDHRYDLLRALRNSDLLTVREHWQISK